MERRKPLERKTPLAADPAKTRAWQDRSRVASKPKRQPVSPASAEQRAKVALAPCVVCMEGPCDPAHLIDRSLGGDDHALAVVPLCRGHHRAYDEQGFDLLPYLEPSHRDEVAHAVRTVGLVAALNRITNDRYEPRRAA